VHVSFADGSCSKLSPARRPPVGRASVGRAHRPVRRPLPRRARRLDGRRRAAVDQRGPRPDHLPAAVDRQRLRARLRRPAPARRPRRRPPGPATRAAVGPRRVHRGLAARRPGQRSGAARRLPLRQGHGRRVHRAGGPLHHHDHVPRGPCAQQGPGHLHGVRRQRVLVRADPRRPHDRGRVALDVPAARPHRAGDPRGRAAGHPSRRAGARRSAQLRHPRRADRHRRHAALRPHRRRGARRRLGVTGDHRLVRPRRRTARALRGDRAAHSPAARAPRDPALGQHRPRQRRGDGDLRVLRRLPVRGHAVPAVDARLVGARDGAGLPARRPDRGLRIGARRRAGRSLRDRAHHRRGLRGLRRRLRAVPAHRQLAGLRRGDPAHDDPDRYRVRADLPGPQHAGDHGRRRSRAGPGLRAGADLLPGRRGRRAGGGQRGRQQPRGRRLPRRPAPGARRRHGRRRARPARRAHRRRRRISDGRAPTVVA
jgi:hypothetical protein